MSTNAKTIKRAAIFLAILGVSTAMWTLQSPAQARRSRAEFMRAKLGYSQKTLAGLTLEDFDAIADSAKELRRLSEAAEWNVPTMPNAVDYVVYTREFQRLTDEMADAAKSKNLDGATLAYLRVTMNCVNCHKYVRHFSR
jgi:hypothetical protein